MSDTKEKKSFSEIAEEVLSKYTPQVCEGASDEDAWQQVYKGLKAGRISIKGGDNGAGTVVVSTGDEKSVILKVMGFEGDHDVPVSLRPDIEPHEDPNDPWGDTPDRFAKNA